MNLHQNFKKERKDFLKKSYDFYRLKKKTVDFDTDKKAINSVEPKRIIEILNKFHAYLETIFPMIETAKEKEIQHLFEISESFLVAFYDTQTFIVVGAKKLQYKSAKNPIDFQASLSKKMMEQNNLLKRYLEVLSTGSTISLEPGDVMKDTLYSLKDYYEKQDQYCLKKIDPTELLIAELLQTSNTLYSQLTGSLVTVTQPHTQSPTISEDSTPLTPHFSEPETSDDETSTKTLLVTNAPKKPVEELRKTKKALDAELKKELWAAHEIPTPVRCELFLTLPYRRASTPGLDSLADAITPEIDAERHITFRDLAKQRASLFTPVRPQASAKVEETPETVMKRAREESLDPAKRPRVPGPLFAAIREGSHNPDVLDPKSGFTK